MKKKKCKDGKNCGATCISRKKVCQLALGNPLGRELAKLSDTVKTPLKDYPSSLPVSMGEIIVAGKEFMEPYKERLKSAFSREERAKKLIDKLEDSEYDSERGGKTLEGKAIAIYGYQNRAFKSYMEIMSEIKSILLKTNLSNDEVTNAVKGINIKTNDSELKSNIRSQIEQFIRMFNGRGVLDMEDNGYLTQTIKNVDVTSSIRPYADGVRSSIGTNGSIKATFHELGHFVESQSIPIEGYANKWRRANAFTMDQIKDLDKSNPVYSLVTNRGEIITSYPYQGLPSFPLRKMAPYASYDEFEIAFVGRYMDPYMGKIYPRQFTEVISKSLESFTHPADMGDLYRNHPDLFEMAVGLAITPASR